MTSELPPEDDRALSRQEDIVVPLATEEVVVSRRQLDRSTVRVATVTSSQKQRVEEILTHEHVEVARVPIGRFVDAVPPVREEADRTVLPVVEERVVIERRLFLKEEVHVVRVRTAELHVETVELRQQEAVISRTSPSADEDRRSS